MGWNTKLKKSTSGRPISRILSSPGGGCTVIYLCSLPGTQTRRAAAHPCLTLLPVGVARPPALQRTPVVSYTTFSPSRALASDAVCFCGPIRQVDLEVSPPRVLPDAMPCGVRTFLDPANAEPRSPNRPEAYSSYTQGERASTVVTM